MSNSPTKRPRRSFATGSATGQPHTAGLRYDGDEVPVLIRLPDLSPQALLRQGAAKDSKLESTPGPAAPARKTPPVLEHPKSVQAEAPNTVESTPPKAKPVNVEPKVAQATVEQSSDERSSGDESTKTTNTDSTPTTTEGSPRKRRRRNRGNRSENVAPRDRVGSSPESPSFSRRRTGETTNIDRQDRNILAFDPSPLIIVVGLLVVAGLTYVVMKGGGNEPEDSPGGWPTAAGSVAGTVDETPESEANLWPNDPLPTMQNESTLAHQPAPGVEAHAPAGLVWPVESTGQPVATYDPTTLPTGDYTYSTESLDAPANGPNNSEPSSNGPVSGWPTESSTATQATSTIGAVNGWPEAAMAAPSTNDRYASQPARFESSERVSSFPDEPAARTGRLETGPYPGRSFDNLAAPGSQLNGTIEIPRPRASNEYNGSSVY